MGKSCAEEEEEKGEDNMFHELCLPNSTFNSVSSLLKLLDLQAPHAKHTRLGQGILFYKKIVYLEY